MTRGKKKSGSDEAIAGSHLKSMNALTDLAAHLEKRNPQEVRPVAGRVGVAPGTPISIPSSSDSERSEVSSIVSPTPSRYGRRSASSGECFGMTPCAQREVDLSLVSIAERAAFPVEAGSIMKKLPPRQKLRLIVNLCSTSWFGCMRFACEAEPKLWVDILFNLFAFLPAFIDFVIWEVLNQFKAPWLLLIDQVFGGPLGVQAQLEQTAQPPPFRPEYSFPAEGPTAFFYPFLCIYMFLCGLVWQVFLK